jgi:ribosomal protein S27AE
MSPGEYLPDVTDGLESVDQLPSPQVIHRSRNYARRRCPRCGTSSPRVQVRVRTLADLGDAIGGRPRQVRVRYSQHRCPNPDCGGYFNADMDDLAEPHARYTHRVVNLAVRLVAEDNCPYRCASRRLWRDHRVFVPFATVQNWVETAGEKGAGGSGGPAGDLAGRGVARLQRLPGAG